MAGKRPPKSLRKYIRKEKARIRREVLDLKKQKEMIQRLYKRFSKKDSAKVGVVKIEQKIIPAPKKA